MRNFKLVIQYDGSRYQGWQKQTSTENTIQGKIEAVLSKMCDKNMEIHGAGRTDAGVHACGQVANFISDTTMSSYEILMYLNQYLPDDISVISCKTVSERFHSRLNAKGKMYRYRVWNHVEKPVFQKKYVYQVPDKLDLVAMNKAASLLCGTHDFQSFTSARKGKKSTVRTIESIQIATVGKEIVFNFKGDGFLYHMIRILVGTLLEVGQGVREADSIPLLFESKDRSQAGYLTPGRGLSLMEVYF
ncbi:MAG: tRNA pseudouridine(38-40) synthase TruA [Lachnospiraceae bacterium]